MYGFGDSTWRLKLAQCKAVQIAAFRHFLSDLRSLFRREDSGREWKQNSILELNMGAVHGIQFADGRLKGVNLVRRKPALEKPLLSQTIAACNGAAQRCSCSSRATSANAD